MTSEAVCYEYQYHYEYILEDFIGIVVAWPYL